MTSAPALGAPELRSNLIYYAGALVLAAVTINVLLMALDAVTHSTGGGSWSALVANYAASSAAGLRYANRNGELGVPTRKRLALAYLAVEVAASLLVAAGLFAFMGPGAFGELTRGLDGGVLAAVVLVGTAIGAGLSYLVSRVALAQAARIHERTVARKAGATR